MMRGGPSSVSSRRIIAVFAATLAVVSLLNANYTDAGVLPERLRFAPVVDSEGKNTMNVTTTMSLSPNRKLLQDRGEAVKPNRIWGERCSKSDIVISQGPSAPLPSGIPTYTVEIMNACVTGCDISGIHLTCGWFSSARLINPKIFKRLQYNDCLVNDGKPLANGRALSFQYANTFRYPLSVSSVIC
ncbi:hypothetical protein RJ641_008956 [Dillenia turbinata]|uniref:Protein TAPETUM DETERMINANT 1 n=1 Tax=Dillenia turbinata TaxID=194707 RepID=A0AAN8Z6U8_9MAGN